MRRSLLITLSGALLGVGVFCVAYLWQTNDTRQAMNTPLPELGWIRTEFDLDEKHYQAIARIHSGYLPLCKEMCRRIDEQNSRLRELLLNSSELTPEIRDALRQSSQLRLECQSAMLEHFYEMSRAMPQEEGKRYLAKMQELTLLEGSHDRMH